MERKKWLNWLHLSLGGLALYLQSEWGKRVQQSTHEVPKGSSWHEGHNCLCVSVKYSIRAQRVGKSETESWSVGARALNAMSVIRGSRYLVRMLSTSNPSTADKSDEDT